MLKMSTNNNSITTESFVPVKAIVNNMIELDSGFKVAGVKIAPKNIFIMEENEQFGVIDGLKDLYNSLNFEYWLVVTDRPVDISVYIAEMQMRYNQATNPVIRKLINQDLKKAEEFNESVSDIEFYILFKDKNIDNIQKNVRLIINGLASAGLSSSQANNEDLRGILDIFLNGGEKT